MGSNSFLYTPNFTPEKSPLFKKFSQAVNKKSLTGAGTGPGVSSKKLTLGQKKSEADFGVVA